MTSESKSETNRRKSVGEPNAKAGLLATVARGCGTRHKEHLLNHSQERNGGCVDDEGEGGTVSEMWKDLLNCSQVSDGVGGAVSEMVKGP
jgi:hypothetical protein